MMLNAKKENMKLSEYILLCINEKQEISGLNDSQGQFLNLFDKAYQKSSSSNVKYILSLLNRIDYNLKVLLKTMDIYMKQLKIPQKKEDVLTTFIDHPIIEIAEQKVLKEMRKTKNSNEEIDNSDS